MPILQANCISLAGRFILINSVTIDASWECAPFGVSWHSAPAICGSCGHEMFKVKGSAEVAIREQPSDAEG